MVEFNENPTVFCLTERSVFVWLQYRLFTSWISPYQTQSLKVFPHFSGKRRYNIKLWKTFTDCFNCLPVAAIVDEKIFCCHGGLSPDLQVNFCPCYRAHFARVESSNNFHSNNDEISLWPGYMNLAHCLLIVHCCHAPWLVHTNIC